MVGEKLLLSVSLPKVVMRFGKKGNLNRLYIGLFEVYESIVEMDYRLALPPSLSIVHPIFHVSMIRKYVGNLSLPMDFSTVQLDGDSTYDVEPMAILDRQVRKLRSKNIAYVKVQWRGHPVEEDTWETAWDTEHISTPI
ncbi:uncharacterized protein [Nicotiana tomentosiformis]|uniref:uncharacterized protein n=1 Tax=Nicotiana tomentosiformis TaxID=4098 RepID=UPI00388CB9D5